ncbi:MAG: diacylglycerol kinase family protein [Verrucomicrobiota bacterium]
METPRRYPLIFNPQARSQKSDRVRRFLLEHAHRFAVHPTHHAGEARELAARFAARGEPVVIAAGGDGTLNEVVNGLAGSTTALGILPVGTMNVFARELAIPAGSLERAFAVIERGTVREVDLFEANGAPFVQMAGVGFDAQVIEQTSWQSKKRLGPLAYLLAAVQVLGERPPTLEVVCADGRREMGVAVITGNGSLYGGPFKFFRHADNRDSKLEVLVYKEAGYRLVLDSLRGLACGGIDLLDSTTYFQTEALTVTGDREVPVEVDGEWLGRFTQVRFAETAHRLRVIAPALPPADSPAGSLRSLWPWRRSRPEPPTTRVP